MTDDNRACQNTDREIYRGPSRAEWGDEDRFYADSIHVTEGGGIGINCGGYVIVKTLRAWHALAKGDARVERIPYEGCRNQSACAEVGSCLGPCGGPGSASNVGGPACNPQCEPSGCGACPLDDAPVGACHSELPMALIRLMGQDNGCQFAATVREVERMSAGLQRMERSGCVWDHEVLDEIVAGEATEVAERFGVFDGYAEVSKTLNEIFLRGHVDDVDANAGDAPDAQVPKTDVQPKPWGRTKTLSAYTGNDSPYPAYINAAYTEGCMVRITVRGERREDGSEGPTAAMSLNIWHFHNFHEVAEKALAAADIDLWPCKQCGKPVHAEDGCQCRTPAVEQPKGRTQKETAADREALARGEIPAHIASPSGVGEQP